MSKEKQLEEELQKLKEENAKQAKVVAASEKARVEAQELADSAIADSQQAREELEAANARQRLMNVQAARPRPGSSKPRTLPIVPSEDIVDAKIKQLHAKAKTLAVRDLADSLEGRAKWAQRVQDFAIALRDLDVGIGGFGLALYEGGDLFVGIEGVHPRMLAEKLVLTHTVPQLVDLSIQLEKQLEHEAA